MYLFETLGSVMVAGQENPVVEREIYGRRDEFRSLIEAPSGFNALPRTVLPVDCYVMDRH